jgi:hypothetical protein
MMRVEQIIPMGRAAGKRLRKAFPRTMDRIQSRVERIGSDVADRFQSVRSNLRSRAEGARKAVRHGTEETAKWVRKNPAALPLIGLGGAALATLLMVRARRRDRGPKVVQGAMKLAKNFPVLRKGFGTMLGRFIAWTLTPRKPHVFRAISIRW